MLGLLDALKSLSDPIRLGLIGLGNVGKGLLLQAQITPGIRCVAAADLSIEGGLQAAQGFGYPTRVVASASEAIEAIQRGLLALSQDGSVVATCEMVVVVLEATSSLEAGGLHALQALSHGKHTVMMNAEADLMFGPYLDQVARQNDLVYTVSDGDQPAALSRLASEVELMGFRLVLAGNIKGYLDRYANPTSIVPEARKRGMDARMCTSYTDGTKLAVEMAVVANGLALRTAVPGMLGPRLAHVRDFPARVNLRELWDGETGLVDYALGAEPKGGVFVVGHTDLPHQNWTLSWFPPGLGHGPFYVFYRPYYLGHFEAMASVAEAVLNRRSVLRPAHGFRTNVYAYAKRDLRVRDRLDGLGGYTCYGLIENTGGPEHHDGPRGAGLPIGLADGAVLKSPLARDERIGLQDVVLDPGRPVLRMHQLAVEAARPPA